MNESNSLASDSAAQKIDQRTQYSTFLVGGRLYGIDVTKVQEVVKPMPMTDIPLSPKYIRGLINLRGQVATAIGLGDMFKLKDDSEEELMNVVCRVGDSLVSIQVDEIGDVVELPMSDFEETPTTIPNQVRRYMNGVYKTKDNILSILCVDKVMRYVNDLDV